IREDDGECRISSGRRHFCTGCGSALWLFDPQWPELVHPHASAIDTPLPTAPERVHMLLDSKADWVPVPDGPHDVHRSGYPDESLEGWHRRHGLLDETALPREEGGGGSQARAFPERSADRCTATRIAKPSGDDLVTTTRAVASCARRGSKVSRRRSRCRGWWNCR